MLYLSLMPQEGDSHTASAAPCSHALLVQHMAALHVHMYCPEQHTVGNTFCAPFLNTSGEAGSLVSKTGGPCSAGRTRRRPWRSWRSSSGCTRATGTARLRSLRRRACCACRPTRRTPALGRTRSACLSSLSALHVCHPHAAWHVTMLWGTRTCKSLASFGDELTHTCAAGCTLCV